MVRQRTLKKIPDGSFWSPVHLEFSDGRSVPSGERWVPAPYMPHHRVTFVRQSNAGEAHVLLLQPGRLALTECRRLVVRAGDECSPADRLPAGWRWRSDVHARLVHTWPRDGDILVPTDSDSIEPGLSSFAAACLLSRSKLGLFVLAALHLAHTVAMVAPPLEQQLLDPVPIGKFPWRLPSTERACYDSVQPGTVARMLSPLVEISSEVPVYPDTTIDEIRVELSGQEPFWYAGIMPLWPAVWQQIAMYAPIPPCRELVCLAVVSPGWHLAVIIPKRTDMQWVLNYLRRHTPGSIVSLRPPPAIYSAGRSDFEAIDWRSGDVLLAFQYEAEGEVYQAPIYTSVKQIRHSALWNFDFQVHCKLPIVFWRPGIWIARTEMPPPAYWDAALGTFRGTFSRRYPGRWVPVPWAHSDEVHLCQCSESIDHCHIILEHLQENTLVGHVHEVSQYSSRYSLACIAGVPAERVSLLGNPAEDDEFPPLRDGDIVFVDAADPSRGSRLRPALRWPMLAALLTCGWRQCSPAPALLLLSLAFSPGLWVTPPASSAANWYGFRSEAVDADVHNRAPKPDASRAHTLGYWLPTALCHVHRSVHEQVLTLMRPYLAAIGSPPSWSDHGAAWHLDLRTVCSCQAHLHSIWWSRPLQYVMPGHFPATYHAAWDAFPPWSGGVPDSLLIATDGSGCGDGSWAFVVWCSYRGRWHRVGWEGASLRRTPWLSTHAVSSLPDGRVSFVSELVALQAAAVWYTSALDQWQLYMSARPRQVVIAVDNASALQVAAGSAAATADFCSNTRVLWQGIQQRVSTVFQHIHSHVGIMVNTFADALAGHSGQRDPGLGVPNHTGSLPVLLGEEGPFLWMVPHASLVNGIPVLSLPKQPRSREDTAWPQLPR